MFFKLVICFWLRLGPLQGHLISDTYAPVMDVENCTHYQKGTCKASEKFCPTETVDSEQQAEILTLQVGNIILATEFDLFYARRVTD